MDAPPRSRLLHHDTGWCLRANRACTRLWIRRYFSTVSRLGDGVFWYLLMAALVLIDGFDGLVAATHMAATGAVALLLYKSLKRWTKRPRPFAADGRIRAARGWPANGRSDRRTHKAPGSALAVNRPVQSLTHAFSR